MVPRGQTYSVLVAGALVVRRVGHVARVSEGDDRNDCFNQLLRHAACRCEVLTAVFD